MILTGLQKIPNVMLTNQPPQPPIVLILPTCHSMLENYWKKNLNENFSKPRRKCSKCRKSGHNISTCPLIPKEKLNARAATADLSFSLSHNPENEFLIEIADNISDKEDQKNDKKCVFCQKLVAVNDSVRPLLFCDSCVAADQLRCPIRVPAQLSPDSNYIFNLHFKSAFNSVSRSSILPLLRKHFPEVEPFFYSFYGKSSTLVYENFDLFSSSGVKQGDPLGPFFFCLAIHPLMCKLKEKFPEIDIVAYMDDISVIAPITILKQIATFIQQRYEDIGLSLNISKCLIIGHEPIDFFINDVNVPFINYDQSGFRFLGCYLGNIDEVKGQLSTLLTQFGNELESIENLNIEKHLKFFFLKICYSGKFTHILRSTSPSISLEFCRIFNEQRTNSLPKLLEFDASQLRSHIFCGTNFGGVDFHKSSYLCKAVYIGGGKNFIYEFVNRFPEKIDLIENCGSSYLISLQQKIETLSPNIWSKCFPSDIVELPPRSLLSLPLTFAKLQKKILKVLENLDYIVRLSMVKEKNPVFSYFLVDLEYSCSNCLISQIPNIYGLLLNDHQ
ncbi:hypothetical protein P9112_011449 [Eukaryota sp. TZLM1-RC]